ncbi:MAG: glutamine synthetase family protein, partial [Steroidobacteraceae bacterium]|nr:glutamine synthetase family protein [Steroidobacteraceae bacterium]MDW8258568.1 glutamine synthetase family protein [Gammaproteobacteria bacterium]
DGDADRPCRPIPGTLLPVPWDRDLAQVQLAMFEADGQPFFGDPRHVLARVLRRFERLALTPVVAIEYEFYFVDRERTAAGLPQPPRLPLSGRREFHTQINSMAHIGEYSEWLAAIEQACRAQDVPVTTALAEYGPAQFEVNLHHQSDALRACDQAIRFKRIVKSVARAHGCDATFLAKPYRDMAGSGLHVHVSLLDREGRNIFACEHPRENAALRHAIAGLLATLADGVAICAPGPNSYRRFRPEAYVPLTAAWSINNRGAAVRIPRSDATNARIEHRLAGADANPYLVTAWVLTGIDHGLVTGAEPPPPLAGNAYRGPAGAPLPLKWPSALERFAASAVARDYLGQAFCELYATVKRAELEDFESYPTPREIEWYMGPL